jgi:phosphatidate cytidylyltransferase
MVYFWLLVTPLAVFVLSLRKGFYRYQFRLFTFAFFGVVLLVLSSCFYFVILEGLAWFMTPCFLIITNDIFAYLVGYFFGKTHLIALSPKKTVEGFVGGAFFTLLMSVFISWVVGQSPYMTCPQNELLLTPFSAISCRIPSEFIPHPYSLLGFNLNLTNFQLHSLCFSLFASVVSPFGGFFASGFKRSIKIKDFGDLIPGHGGLIDRFDCQLINGVFVLIYIRSFVRATHIDSLTFLLQTLTPLQRTQLTNYLV